MSEKMTDEAVRRTQVDLVEGLDIGCLCGDDGNTDLTEEGVHQFHEPRCKALAAERALKTLFADHDRARASEAEKDKALQEKDATIKALADVLDHLHQRVALSHQNSAMVTKALRLAGRLP